MKACRASVFTLVLLGVIGMGTAEAQRHRFTLGGGGGFSTFGNPDLSLGRPGTLGGFFGIRFTDQISVQTNFTFGRSNQLYDDNSEAIDAFGAIPSFRFETNRYHLDASFLYHFGRRQPFHPFVSGGAGGVLRTTKRTEFEILENNQVFDAEIVETDDTEPTFHFGAGFDLYFLSNVAARVEFRWRFPQTSDRRTRLWLFSASYFF